ncbi:MAG: hypothetical protein AAF183_09565 [Pseudomonadota bacterium]
MSDTAAMSHPEPSVTPVPGVPRPDPGDERLALSADALDLAISYGACAADGGGRVRIDFDLVSAHYLGWPNDEALSGHPLWGAGLTPYAVQEVAHSPWIRSIERGNRVHPRHSSAIFDEDRHLVITFHDRTFECICHGYRVTKLDGVSQ